jgi:hypothetical protein
MVDDALAHEIATQANAAGIDPAGVARRARDAADYKFNDRELTTFKLWPRLRR